MSSASYYGRPILKEPVWKPEVPIYMFTGGLAGACSVLSLAARLAGKQRLSKVSLFVGLAAEIPSPILLISDLGRPERFLNMLRVFKPTSPMSVGSWILAASSGATTTAAACEVLGVAPRLKLAAGIVSASAGAPLSVYTATLISNTAVPVWHEARRELPFLFAAESAASAGAATALVLAPREAAPARRLALFGVAASELIAARMRKSLGAHAEVYEKEEAGEYERLARATGVVGSALLAGKGRRGRPASLAGGMLVLGSVLARRWSIFRAGFQSARDPRYTVEPQRARVEREAAGS
jgi:formate-dependent nitrite reductase membrane component NrfD